MKYVTIIMYVGLILLGSGWYYAGYAGGFNVPMVGIIPLTTIILIVLFVTGAIMVGFSFMKKYGHKIKSDE